MAAMDIGIIIPGEILSRNTLAHFWHELRLIVAEWNSKGGGPPWVDLNNADTRRMLRYELSGRTTPLYINGWVIRPTS